MSTERKRYNPKTHAPAVYIPCWLIQVSTRLLSNNAKVLYGRLSQWCNQQGDVYRSLPQLSQELGTPWKTLKRHLKELKDVGLMGTYHPQAGGVNHYEFYQHKWMDKPIHENLSYVQVPENPSCGDVHIPEKPTSGKTHLLVNPTHTKERTIQIKEKEKNINTLESDPGANVSLPWRKCEPTPGADVSHINKNKIKINNKTKKEKNKKEKESLNTLIIAKNMINSSHQENTEAKQVAIDLNHEHQDTYFQSAKALTLSHYIEPDQLPDGLKKELELVKKANLRATANDMLYFDEFFALYPKNTGRKQALLIWFSEKCNENAAEICEKIKTQLDSGKYFKKGFIQAPVNYLSGARWKDDVEDKIEGHQSHFNYQDTSWMDSKHDDIFDKLG